jgi:hypothetical protein
LKTTSGQFPIEYFAAEKRSGSMFLPFSVSEYSIWTGLPAVTILMTIPESSRSFRRFDKTFGLILPNPLLILPNLSAPKNKSRRIETYITVSFADQAGLVTSIRAPVLVADVELVTVVVLAAVLFLASGVYLESARADLRP